MKESVKSSYYNEKVSLLDYNSQVLNQFKRICEPLIQNFSITHFLYVRVFKNGNYFLLSHDLTIVDYFMNYMKVNNSAFFENFKPIKKEEFQKFIWPIDRELALPGLKFLQSLGIHHGLNIVTRRKEDDSIENFIFATSSHNTGIYNFYINNFDVLNRFICYFKIKASKIIENPVTKKLAYSPFYHSEMQRIENVQEVQESSTMFPLMNFLNETKLQSYPVKTTDGQEIFLSERQTECLYHLTNGKTAKEIAKCLGISYRTVQTHLNIVNEKVGGYSKSSTIECLSDNIKKFLDLNYKKQATFLA